MKTIEMPVHAEGWQRFMSWDHETLAKLAADLLTNNKQKREQVKQLQSEVRVAHVNNCCCWRCKLTP
jgi:hypothetical protein